MREEPQLVPDDVRIAKLERRTRRLLIVVLSATALLSASIACFAFFVWKKGKAIDEILKNQAFSEFETDYNNSTDFVSPQVNTIQFLRHGYSITFDGVQYTQEGLVLSGTIGNPTQLWISSLALKLSARPYPYKIRDKWDKTSFPFWDSDWDIGSGQTTVGVLNPGTSAFFNVSIPNVKQSSDQIQIAVSFTGERYSYLK